MGCGVAWAEVKRAKKKKTRTQQVAQG